MWLQIFCRRCLLNNLFRTSMLRFTVSLNWKKIHWMESDTGIESRGKKKDMDKCKSFPIVQIRNVCVSVAVCIPLFCSITSHPLHLIHISFSAATTTMTTAIHQLVDYIFSSCIFLCFFFSLSVRSALVRSHTLALSLKLVLADAFFLFRSKYGVTSKRVSASDLNSGDNSCGYWNKWMHFFRRTDLSSAARKTHFRIASLTPGTDENTTALALSLSLSVYFVLWVQRRSVIASRTSAIHDS